MWNSTKAFWGNGIHRIGGDGVEKFSWSSQGFASELEVSTLYDWEKGIEWTVTIPDRNVGWHTPYSIFGISDGVILAKSGTAGNYIDFDIAYDMETGQEIWIHDKAFARSFSRKFDVLKKSDIVTVHISGQEGVIGKASLDLMKDGSYLVNMARKECVNEETVADALKSGKLQGFASDVNGEKFVSYYSNVILTPHVASSTPEARKAMEEMAVENLIRELRNRKE